MQKPTDCLIENENYSVFDRKQVLSDEQPWKKTSNIPSNVIFTDLTNYFCINESCPQIIGNVVVYRYFYHISATYASTLVNAIRPEIIKALNE